MRRTLLRPCALLAALPLTALPLTALPLIALPLTAAAQQARTLPAPNATYDEPFSQVGGLRELSNGRVLVADARDKIVSLVDLASGSAEKVGREGSGPGEFGLPMRLFVAPGDTTLLFDPLNTRYLVIGPDGKPKTTFMVETAAPTGQGGPGGGPGFRIGGMTMARVSDARGRLYGETPPIAVGADGRPQTADSAAITRYDRVSKKLDTLAWVRLPKNNAQVSGSGSGRQQNVQVRIGGANPLAARDEWTVFPDGRIAIVRASDYHVDWILPNGQKRSSPAIKHTAIRMTEADKREEEALRNRSRANQMMMTVENGPNGVRRSAQMGPGANAPPLEPLTDWPEVKPPFRPGQSSVWARPNGDLWVRRTEPAGAKGALYDVIDAQGAVMYQVRLPTGITLVGFGNGTIYTTKADEDDLLYLQRHAVGEVRLVGQGR
jgi:hypothetical protein